MTEIRDDIATSLAQVVGWALNMTAAINEPEPTRWEETVGDSWAPENPPTILKSLCVQDEGAPDRLSFVRGAVSDPTEELEVTLIVALAVQVKPGLHFDTTAVRQMRRLIRKEAVAQIVDAIDRNRTLGLTVEVYAEIDPPAYADDVVFQNALPCATALIPVRVLYTGANAAS